MAASAPSMMAWKALGVQLRLLTPSRATVSRISSASKLSLSGSTTVPPTISGQKRFFWVRSKAIELTIRKRLADVSRSARR